MKMFLRLIPLLTVSFSITMVASAATNADRVTGTVEDISPIISSHIQKTPIRETVCHTEEVPVYRRVRQNNDGHTIGGVIIGGVLGSVIGNKVSDDKGAGAVGAVAGALLGHEVTRNRTSSREQIVSYRQRDVCEEITTLHEERIETIKGYKLSVLVDDEVIALESKRKYQIGDDIRVNRRITYSIR